MAITKQTMSVVFQDRLDRQFSIRVEPNEYVAAVLNRNHIPIDAVIVRKNGEILDDWQAQFEPNGEYTIEMVRAYHLPDFLSLLRLWDTPVSQGKWKTRADSYYTRRTFWLDEEGDFEARQSSFNQEEFVQYTEQLFADGVLSESFIQPGERVALALSGGRDSMALGYLFHRTREILPPFSLLSVNVGAIAKPKDIAFAREIAQEFGFAHRFITSQEIADIFRFNVSPETVLERVRAKFTQAESILLCHVLMRVSVEHVARTEGISTIAYGLQSEDLVAAILKGKMLGFPFHGPMQKQYGDFRLIYPLWTITKKELTLYLEAVRPAHNTQGSPTIFDRGALTRDVFYFLADSLQTLYPGMATHLLAAHAKELERLHFQRHYGRCQNCEGVYVLDEAPPDRPEGICDVCSMLNSIGVIKI